MEAIRYIENAYRPDPRDPNTAFADWSFDTCYLLLGDLERATRYLSKATTENQRLCYFRL